VSSTVSADRSNGDKLLCMPAEVMGTSYFIRRMNLWV